MKKTEPRTKLWGTPQVREDEGEMCGVMAMEEVRNEIYEVNQCSEREKMTTK